MKILIVNDARHFILLSARDAHDVALKILNEKRNMRALEGSLKEFVDAVCDDLDGETAWSILEKLDHLTIITPETTR